MTKITGFQLINSSIDGNSPIVYYKIDNLLHTCKINDFIPCIWNNTSGWNAIDWKVKTFLSTFFYLKDSINNPLDISKMEDSKSYLKNISNTDVPIKPILDEDISNEDSTNDLKDDTHELLDVPKMKRFYNNNSISNKDNYVDLTDKGTVEEAKLKMEKPTIPVKLSNYECITLLKTIFGTGRPAESDSLMKAILKRLEAVV